MLSSSDKDSYEFYGYRTASFLTGTDRESTAEMTSQQNIDAEAGMLNIIERKDSTGKGTVDVETMKRPVGTTVGSSKDQQDTVDGTDVLRQRDALSQSQSAPFRRQAMLSKLLQEDESSSDEELYTISTAAPMPKLMHRSEIRTPPEDESFFDEELTTISATPSIAILKPPTQQLQQSTAFPGKLMEDVPTTLSISIVKPPTQQLQQSTGTTTKRMEDVILPDHVVSNDPAIPSISIVKPPTQQLQQSTAFASKLMEDVTLSDHEVSNGQTIPSINIIKPPTQQLQQSTAFERKLFEDVTLSDYAISKDPADVSSKSRSSINSNSLLEMKSRLKATVTSTKRGPIMPEQVKTSPAAKLPKTRKNTQTDKAQTSKIKASWKVRQCLANLPYGENVNTLYLTLVRRGMHREVEALLKMAKVMRGGPFAEFDENFLNEEYDSALTIAVDMKDETMMRKLMEHQVDVGLSIFHAIEADFMEGLKLILAYNACENLKIASQKSHFEFGMTPMLMAAHKNNYRILSLLYQNGHKLLTGIQERTDTQVHWEASNAKRMICLARVQPAYITLTTEINRKNPMEYCLDEIKELRRCPSEEHEFGTFYCDIKNKYEEYMCSLLDLVRSSDELSHIFQYNYKRPQTNNNIDHLEIFIDDVKSKRSRDFSTFKILERASRENLVKFVTHRQSQLALECIRYRTLPILRNKLLACGIGLLFPLLSLCYVLFPDTVPGGIITLPVVSFYCHMMSDLVFAFLLVLQLVVRDAKYDRLGTPVSTLEWIIFLWILGKWVQEFQEWINRGCKAYFRDIWNYTDFILLTLFSTSIVIRFYDAFHNGNSEHMGLSRYEWGSFEPRLIGEGLQAFGYVFLFLRLLGLMRVDRYLGPLQISLGKMLADVVRFLCLFALVLGAFAFGINDLYWYYGTVEGSKLFCNETATNSSQKDRQSCQKTTVAFTSILDSIVELFWALFGLFELDKMSLGGKHVYTEYVGKCLVATYHVVAILVMLNMLIAMMSKTYEDTSENEEIAWKFHRTSVWIRFIRREVVRPPPMNLFPNPRRLKENMGRLRNFCRQRCQACKKKKRIQNSSSTSKSSRQGFLESCLEIPASRLCCRSTETEDFIEENIVETDNCLPDHQGANDNRNKLSKTEVLTELGFRYKIKHLTKKSNAYSGTVGVNI